MQKRLSPGKLLDESGCLQEAGYATRLVKEYRRGEVRAGALRIKEWDYYLVSNEHFGVALTVADNSYMGLVSLSFLDFEQRTETTVSPMSLFPMGRTKMPSSSDKGDVRFCSRRCQFSFVKEDGRRILIAKMKNFKDGQSIRMKIHLTREPDDSMVIAVPFKEHPHAFYYNQKIIGMRAKGVVEIGNRRFCFRPEDSFGLLDWGRGAWPYENTWYWSAAQGLIDGQLFGFNLGCGFGDTRSATENMLFFEGRAHKLERIRFLIPGEEKGQTEYLKTWNVMSDDERLSLTFTPILDRSARTSAGMLLSDQHQVFGHFNGTAVLDDGTKIPVKQLPGFAEKVHNKW